MRVEWLTIDDVDILYADFRGLKGDALIPVLEEAAAALEKTDGGQLFLANFQNTSFGVSYARRCNELGTAIIHPKTDKMAFVGIDGLKALALAAFNKLIGQDARNFSDEDDAIDWLLED